METPSLKPDFTAARECRARYWDGSIGGRPITSIVIPKPGCRAAPGSILRPHGGMEKAALATLEWARSHEWLADSVPGVQITFAPDHFAMLLGADMAYDDGSLSNGTPTGWVHPCMDGCDWEIRFRPEWKWRAKTVEAVRAFRKVCDGHLIVSGTNMQGGLDSLAALRGPQNLLMDVLDRPDDVHGALRRIDAALAAVCAALAEELDTARWGSVTRHGAYSTGLCDMPQGDFSAMISEDDFRGFELPWLIRETNAAQGNMYHPDGKEAIRHLPALASAPKIHCIQWVASASGQDKD